MQTRQCTKCLETKELSMFPKSKRTVLGVGSWCRKCKGELDFKRSKENPLPGKLAKRKYYEKNKEVALERSKKWDRDNPKKAQARHDRWYLKHPELKKIYAQSYSNRKANAPGRGLTEKEWKEILELYGNKCLKCGSSKRLTIDHVIPLSVGGWHDPVNIQPLCHSCNSGKRDKVMDYRPKIAQVRGLLLSKFLSTK